jgi:SAM-dependent methyltransferase
LDVGFGRGDYLQDMRANGWEVYGVDLSPRAIAEAQRKDLCVFQGTLVSVYRQLPQPLDVVTFFDSFEHHPNPIETLECVAVLLRPGGELIIEFPNYGSPWRRIFGRYWADLAPPQHYFHYSSAVLTRLVERCGFAVDAVFARPSSEIQRSWQIRRIALGHEDAPLEGWGRLLDRLVGRGHLMLRARKR